VMDAGTGFTYMQARYYDPLLPRFLSGDPAPVDAKMGANFNRYWYANNNPYKFTDPDGRLVFLAIPIVVGAEACAASVVCGAAAIATGAYIGKKIGDGVRALRDNNQRSESAEDNKGKSGDSDRNPKDDQRLSGGEIKKLEGAGHDVHELKGGKNASKQDLFKDKKGDVYVKPKSGTGPGDPTGINLKDLDKKK